MIAPDTGAPGTARPGAREDKLALFLHEAAPGGIVDEAFLSERGNFREFVRADVRGLVPEAASGYLRRAEVAARWLAELRSTARVVEGKLATRAADAAAGEYGRFSGPAEYERWRGRALYFLGHLEARVPEAEELRGRGSARGDAGLEDILTGVRRYLVDEARLPEAERGPRRERALEAVTKAIALRQGP